MKTETVAIESVSPDPANARKHGEKNLASIRDSLRAFGQQKPIVVDSRGIVIAGNGTLECAKSLGWKEISIVRTDLDPSQATAFGIADNRTSELAEWDDEVLRSLLDTMDDQMLDVLAFDQKEIDALLPPVTVEIEEDEISETVEARTKPGDLWIMGRHRLLCGNSMNADDVNRLMDGKKADLCFTSPPYAQQRDYGVAKEIVKDWDSLMNGVFANLPMSDTGQVLVNLGLFYRENQWVSYWDQWVSWMEDQGWKRFGWYVWDQGSGLPGDWNGRYGPSFEFVFHFNKSAVRPTKWVETKEQSRAAKGSTNAKMGFRKEGGSAPASSPHLMGQDFKIPDSVIRVNRSSIDGKMHPATFPVKFASYILQSWEGLIYEPFCGSGTTMIAAEQLGRESCGIEIDPTYCDVIVDRWEKLTGETATK